MFISVAFFSGLVIGLVVMWRWGGMMKRQPFADDEAEQLNQEALAAIKVRIEMRKNRIMEAANALGKITNDGVEDLFCISDRTASSYLRQLTEEGRLERQGSGRGTYYVPVKK